MKKFFWIPLFFIFVIFPSCSTGGGNSNNSGNNSTLCSTLQCFLSQMFIQDNTGAAPVQVTLVSIPLPSPPTPTSGSNPGQTPKILKLNGSITSSNSTVSLSSLLEPTDTEPFDWDFDDPTGCTPGLCFSCPANVQCSSMVCSHGTVGDGKLAGSVIQTLGFKAEPADSASTEDLQLQINPIVGPVDPATGDCTDPIDDSDPSNPTLAPGVLVGDPIETTTEIVGPDAPGGINNGGSAGGGGGGGGGSSGTTCSGNTPTGNCGTFQACVTQDANGDCTSAFYQTSSGDFTCATCTDCNGAAQNAVSACIP